jgi:hypothetical protein
MSQKFFGFLKQSVLILVGALLLASCCCDDDDDYIKPASTNRLQTGYFVDSPVQGLKYKTESQEGFTDIDGSFKYNTGETITFSICPTDSQKAGQEIILGQTVQCKSQMSPVDLVPSAASDTDPIKNRAVTNISRLLQALDNDGDLSNGIYISDDVRDEVAGRVILFDQPTADFSQDNEIIALFHRLNTMDPDPFSDLGDRQLVTPTQAQTHLRESIYGPIKEIIITPKSPYENDVTPELPIGLVIGFKAIAHYEDRDSRDITKIVTWASSDSFISDFTNNIDSDGYVIFNAKNPGTAKVNAILDGEIGRINLHITPATLQRIDIKPDYHEMAKGELIEFTAIGTYSNGYTDNITDQVVWDSSDTAFAFFSHNMSEKGLIEAVLPGTTKISAAFDGITGYADLSVVDATLKHIEVIPINETYPKGVSIQFTARGRFSDGDLKDITNQVEWVSYNALVASVSQNGIVRAENVGKTRIKAIHRIKQDIIGSTEIMIDPPIAVSVEITPKNVTIAKGDPKQFTATATYSDEGTRDVTKEVQWESSNTSIAIVDTKGLLNTNHTQTYNYPVKLQLTAILDKITGSRDVIIDEAKPKTVQIFPEKVSIAKGDSVAFTAIVHYTDGKEETLFPAHWWKHNTNTLGTKADFSTSINAYSVSTNPNTNLGVADVQVVIGTGPYQGDMFTSKLTVEKKVLRRIIIGLKGKTINLNAPSPETYTFPYGVTPQLEARGIYSDGTSISLTTKAAWSSSVTQVATINNDQFKGLVDTYQRKQGQTIIRAMYENVVQPLNLNVIEPALTSIELYPDNFTLPLDEEQIFTAIGVYTDKSKNFITSQLTWESDSKTIAMFTEDSRTGVLIGMKSGDTIIKATGKTRTLDGEAQSIHITKTTSVKVINKKPVSLSILPEMPVIALGRSQKFTATVKYSDDSTDDKTSEVSWTSSVTQTATIDQNGFAETKSNLTSTYIHATIYGLEDFTKLTVGPHALDEIKISREENKNVPVSSLNISFGGIQYLRALGQYSDYTLNGKQYEDITTKVKWSTASPEASMNTATFGCKGMRVGNTTLSASLSGITRTINVAITKDKLSSIEIVPSDTFVSVGTPKQFQAIGKWDNDGYTQNITDLATWHSSSYTILAGLIIPSSKSSSIEISAEYDSIISDKAKLEVYDSDLVAIDIDSPIDSLADGRSVTLTARLRFADLSSKTDSNIQWKVLTPGLIKNSANMGNRAIFTADPTEEAIANATGDEISDATIEASIHGVTGRVSIKIFKRALDVIDLCTIPDAGSISLNQLMYISAIGTYSDGYTENISPKVSWTSSNDKVAQAGHSTGFKGTITPKSVGSTTITAESNGITREKMISVYKKGLSSININPPYPKIPVGHSLQITAIGEWGDGYTQILTEQVAWATSDVNIITFSDTKGLVKALANGSASITATYQDNYTPEISGSTILKVPQVLTGVFKDSAVQGLSYETLTQRGITNSNGEFTYLDGEKITFSIRNVVLGSGMAKALMTPIDLVDDAYDYNHPKVVTICRFLQSLDINGYLDDGIYISSAIANVIETSSINLNNVTQFEHDMNQLLPNLKNLFTANIERSLVTADEAKKHLRETVFGVLKRIDVVADSLSVPIGKTTTFFAFAVFSKYTLDVTDGVTWSASKENWVSFDQNSIVQPLSNIGSVDIIATYDDLGVVTEGKATLIIIDAVPDYIVIEQIPDLNEGHPIPLGDSVQMSATVFYSDGLPRPETSHTIMWDIDDKTVATIDQDGKVTAAKAFGQYTQTKIVARLASMESVKGALQVSIKDKELKEIKLSSETFSIPNGKEKMLEVIGIYTNGEQIALTRTHDTHEVNVYSDSEFISTRFEASDNHFYVKALSVTIPYSENITVNYQEFEDTALIQVTEAVPDYIVIEQIPDSNEGQPIPLGDSVQLSATVFYTDGLPRPDTNDTFTWAINDTTVATIDQAGKVTAAKTFGQYTQTTIIAVIAGMEDIKGYLKISIKDKVLKRIEVSPEKIVIPNGKEKMFEVTGIYSNGDQISLTHKVTFPSDSDIISTRFEPSDNHFYVKALSVTIPYSENIIVNYQDFKDTVLIQVTEPEPEFIIISPSQIDLPLGDTIQLSAKVYYSDESYTENVQWKVENPSVAKVNESTGLVKAVDVFPSDTRTTKITASFNGLETKNPAIITLTDAVLKDIDVSPDFATIANGDSVQLTATGIYTNGDTKILSSSDNLSWSSSHPADTTIESGNISINADSYHITVTITAAIGDIPGKAFIYVTEPRLVVIGMTPGNKSIFKGESVFYNATGYYSDKSTKDLTDTVTWKSSNETIAKFDGSNKIVTDSKTYTGTIVVTAEGPNNLTNATNLTVKPEKLMRVEIKGIQSIPKGLTVQFSATGIYTDDSQKPITTNATWESNQANLLVFDSLKKGMAKANATGQVIINAECNGIVSSDFQFEITDAILRLINISPVNPVLPEGISQNFIATGIYSDLRDYDITDKVQWKSSETAVATIEGDGVATAESANMATQTTISAHFDGITGTTRLTVNDAQLIAIALSTDISITNATVPKGTIIQFFAKGTYTDGEIRDLNNQQELIWSSTNGSIINIDEKSGIAKAIDASHNPVSIGALWKKKFNQYTLSVSSASLLTITISPENETIHKGQDLQYKAQGEYTDGSIQDITNLANWIPSDPRVASFISKNGLITAIETNKAPVIIKATLDNKEAETILTVEPEILDSIFIAPVAPAIWINPATVSEGYTLTLHATGIMTDDSLDQNLSVEWSSKDTSIAKFANANIGVLEGIKVGTVEIIATSTQNSAITRCFSVEVTPHSLEFITITADANLPNFDPQSPSVPIGYTQLTFTALGHYSDGLMESLTSQIDWSVEIGNQITEIVVIDQTGNTQVKQPEEITNATIFSIYAIFEDTTVGKINLEIIP